MADFNNSKVWYSLTLGLSACLCLLACGPADTSNTGQDISLPVSMSATDFLNLLPERQRESVQLAFDDSARTSWTYQPHGHSGLPLKDMTLPQQLAALALVRNAMSDEGFKKAQQVRLLEEELRKRSFFSSYIRDPNRYYTTLFGTPGAAPWSWRFEGHHLSINLTWLEGKVIASTPYFIGANPARLGDVAAETLPVLATEEYMARTLILSLEEKQKRQAVIATHPPDDILTGDDPKVDLPCCEGLPARNMNLHQQRFLRTLIGVIVGHLNGEMTQQVLQSIEGEGINEFYFAWAGTEEAGKPHYYRIHGPKLLIEFDKRGSDANHAHLVWRNPANDFGRDVLAEHYKSQQH